MDVKKINFRQPKYLLPAILYFPILFVGYFVIDMFQTDVSSNKTDPRLKTTDYLSGDLPEANTDSLLGDKMNNTEREFGQISDLSGVNSLENDNDSVNKKEEYESKYSNSEASSVERQEAEEKDRQARLSEQNKLRELQNNVRQSRTSSDFVSPVTDSDIEKVQRLRRQRDWESMNKELSNSSVFSPSGSKEQGTNRSSGSSFSSSSAGSDYSPSPNGDNSSYRGSGGQNNPQSGEEATYNEKKEDSPKRVFKKERETSVYFNTITADRRRSNMISAIIDENIKAVDGSRVRLRLLEDIIVEDMTIRKGTYIYAIMSGFSKQRVQGKIESIFLDEEIVKVELKMFDTDGMEGLYVPQSSFRETTQDVLSSATQGGNNLIDNNSSGTGIKSWANQTVQQASQRVMQALGKAAKKNVVRLKYGTRVYLVDESQKDKKKGRN